MENFKLSPDPEDGQNQKDKERMKTLVKEARKIIEDPSSYREISTFEKLNNDLAQEESKNLLINIEKGTDSEIFFRTLVEEVPKLRLSVNKAKAPDGSESKRFISIRATPFVTDKEFIGDLLHDNRVISLLAFPLTFHDKERRCFELEDLALIPEGSAARILCRWFLKKVENNPQAKDQYEEEFKKYEGIEPYSDDEMRELMRKEIIEEAEDRF